MSPFVAWLNPALPGTSGDPSPSQPITVLREGSPGAPGSGAASPSSSRAVPTSDTAGAPPSLHAISEAARPFSKDARAASPNQGA